MLVLRMRSPTEVGATDCDSSNYLCSLMIDAAGSPRENALIDQLQTVGSLERQHPSWILRGKSADLIQLAKLVTGECEFDRREIVLKLIEAFRANDDRGHHRLCQEPCERDTRRTTPMRFGDRSHHVEDIPGPLFVHDGKVVFTPARICGLLVGPAELAGKQAAGKRTPYEQADLLKFQQRNDFSF